MCVCVKLLPVPLATSSKRGAGGGQCKRVGKVESSEGLWCVTAITRNYKQNLLSFIRCSAYPCTCCISSPFVHAVLLVDLCVLLLVVLRVLG